MVAIVLWIRKRSAKSGAIKCWLQSSSEAVIVIVCFTGHCSVRRITRFIIGSTIWCIPQWSRLWRRYRVFSKYIIVLWRTCSVLCGKWCAVAIKWIIWWRRRGCGRDYTWIVAKSVRIGIQIVKILTTIQLLLAFLSRIQYIKWSLLSKKYFETVCYLLFQMKNMWW